MSPPETQTGNEIDTDDTETNDSLSFIDLVAGAIRHIRADPRIILALLVAGIVVSSVGWLRLSDPIPTVGFQGVLNGQIFVSFGIAITIISRTLVPLSALVGLKPQWLLWAVGLELIGFIAVTGAGAYALSRLLWVQLTTAATLRYALVMALLQVWVWTLHPEGLEGGALLVAISLFVGWLFVLVRLFPLPGLLVAGESISSALRRSWRLTAGHGWSLLAVVLLLGVLNHLLTSIPVIGSLGSAFVAVVHVGTVAAFLHLMNMEGTTIGSTTAIE